ncbi:hypothetical protein BBP40_006876 [Aspergillus hancockii]|nr:hypothetical protein BBP40_006876 [Aspergillus hancockii]
MSGSQDSRPGRSAEQAPNYQTFEEGTRTIYNRLIRKERHERGQYELIDAIYNILAILQVMIGASITALGPYGDKYMLAVTVLGAVNTTIAGLIALLKGRGLPQRPRKNMVELRKARKYIEEQRLLRECGNGSDDVNSLMKEAIKRYNLAEDIIERNQPDTYSNTLDEEAGQH